VPFDWPADLTRLAGQISQSAWVESSLVARLLLLVLVLLPLYSLY